MIKVALDAMGGDNAPEAVVEGAVLAAREAAGRYGIVLTGPEEVVKPLLAKYGGAGTLVPITGFANSIVAPAMEFKSEGFVLGIGAKMFVIAGPVLVYSTAASILYGLILWFFHLY